MKIRQIQNYLLILLALICCVALSSRVVHVFLNGEKQGQDLDLQDCDPSTILKDVIKDKLTLTESVFSVYSATGYVLERCSQATDNSNLYLVPKGKKFRRPQFRKPVKLSGKSLSWPVICVLVTICIFVLWAALTSISLIYSNKSTNAILKGAFSNEERLKRNMVNIFNTF